MTQNKTMQNLEKRKNEILKELNEIFGLGKKKEEEKIELDGVIAEKRNDGTWSIYKKQYSGIYPRPNLVYGMVKYHPDGLIIFSYYEDGLGKHSTNAKNFKVSNIQRALKYVVDKLKEKEGAMAIEKTKQAELKKKSELEYTDELS